MIKLIVQSLNNKTVDLINMSDMSRQTINSNELVELPYGNYIVDVHTDLSSFSLANFWQNLSSLTQDAIIMVLFVVSITLISFGSKLIKIYGR